MPSDVAIDPKTDWDAGFSLAGLDDAKDENLKWFRTDLKIGDEITLKLVETDQIDAPTEVSPSKSED